MAAYTSSQDGNWSDTATWGGSGPPGNGDTVTINHNVTLTGNVTVGSSPATGGTAAIKFGNVTGKTLNLGAYRLICKGDIDAGTAYLGINTVLLGAGARITFFPPSGQQYAFRPNAANTLIITANGTSGNHCTIDTDKSSSGLSSFTNDASASYKIVAFNLAYTDIADFGTSTQFGIGNRVQGAVPVSITNCTFTRSSFAFTEIDAVVWSGTLTFEDNTFASSVPVTSGSSRICEFDFLGNSTASIQRNGFDDTIRFGDFKPGVVFAYNAHASVTFAATSSWSTDDAWHHNFGFVPEAFGSSVSMYGPIRDCYLAVDDPTNPQFFPPASSVTNTSYTRCLYEATNTSNDGAGDCNATAPSQTISVTNCIILPTHGTNIASGTLFTMNTSSGGQDATVNHNTIVGDVAAAINYGEGSLSEASQFVAIKSNLFANLGSVGATTYKLFDLGHQTSGGTQDVCAPTAADYNASLNYRLTPAVGNTYTNANNGYQGDFSAVPGTHDVTISADPFVDSTRNLRTWGTTQGTDGTLSAAVALLRSNPSLIATATTGLLEWVRDGFKVTSTTLKDAGHDGVTIGAMGYLGAAGFTVSPSTIPANHPGHITLTLTGTGTSWDNTTVFDLSGVSGVTKVSQTVNSATSATIVVTTE
jgi:hypothetical protein